MLIATCCSSETWQRSSGNAAVRSIEVQAKGVPADLVDADSRTRPGGIIDYAIDTWQAAGGHTQGHISTQELRSSAMRCPCRR